jgi:15-cis-phytoene synthase
MIETVRQGLTRAARHFEDLPVGSIDGKLLRPLVAWTAGGYTVEDPPPEEFWFGALAIQMVHEASLLHDDIVDGASHRRGEPALVAERGVAVALIEGDHLLTAAYRVAARTGSMSFMRAFTRAVERTVAGERAQGRARGRILDEDEYQAIVRGKSGELFGCAVALSACLRGEDPEPGIEVGLRLGCLYQRVDDFLDLCPDAALGKPALQDLAQRKWTWPLGIVPLEAFPEDLHAFAREVLVLDAAGDSVLRGAVRLLDLEVGKVLAAAETAGVTSPGLAEILAGWVRRARRALDAREQSMRMDRVRDEAAAIGSEWTDYFAEHSKSFRFSARLFPKDEGRLVAGVYAFCRFTDDLVDDAPKGISRPELDGRLDAWRRWVERAWQGEETGIPFLDEVIGASRARGVRPEYSEALIRGVEMDLEPTRFEDLAALRVYSYRVASVVGLWLTELFGTRDPRILERAEAMGHAMQLTNILRDVGEDWRRGRLYLPLDRLTRYGITPEAIGLAVESDGLPDRWEELMEDLMGEAERDYARAFEAIPELPAFFRRPVAVAGRVYRAIHREIRKNDYDNLHRRAWTSLPRKVWAGGAALLDLRRAASAQLGGEAWPGWQEGQSRPSGKVRWVRETGSGSSEAR